MLRLLISLLLALPTIATATESLIWVGQPQPDQEQQPDVLVWTAWTGPSLVWLEEQLDTYGRIGGISIGIGSFTLGELRKEAVLAAQDTRIADVLVGVPHDQITELAGAGLLADVSTYATAEYLADLPDQASYAFRHDGALLGLPLTLEGPALLVNTALVPELPRSYSEFITSAGRLERHSTTAGFRFDFGNLYFAWAWLGSYGASLIDAGVGSQQAGLASPAAVSGARTLQDLRFEHALIPAGSDYESASELFAAARLGYIFDGPWAVARYFAASVPLTVMPVPPVVAGHSMAGFMTVHGVLVTSDSQARTAAANTAKWLVRSAAQLQLAEQAGRIPASIQAVDSLEHDEILYGFGMALRNARAIPTDTQMAQVWPALGRVLQQLDQEPLTDDQLLELLEQAQTRIDGD